MICFSPKPDNIFESFLEEYFSRCKEKVPQIEAIAGKWRFEDLVPGLSDFDTRFVCRDDMNDDDWCAMSMAVGTVHLQMCGEKPELARILEHLPGVNPTWEELTQEPFYYPEYRQWTLYRTCNEPAFKKAQGILLKRPWDEKDELFYLKKFFTFYGPYQRGIDPPINLGAFENKYALHSRAMHYFTPPVQAAVSVLLRSPICGKMEALHMAAELFPNELIFEEIFDLLDCHYEKPEYYEEPRLSEFELALERALVVVWSALRKEIHSIPNVSVCDAATIKSKVKAAPVSPLLALFDSSKFCRLFKGRLYFYVNAPEHFDNIWLIQNELSRVKDMFYKTPFCLYWNTLHKKKENNPDHVARMLASDGMLTRNHLEALLEFSRLACGTWKEGEEITIAKDIVDVFDDVFRSLNIIKVDLIKRTLADGEGSL